MRAATFDPTWDFDVQSQDDKLGAKNAARFICGS